ncbi:MAG TPA: hypothetical protein VIY27_05040 [Myxococcota bacterium]
MNAHIPDRVAGAAAIVALLLTATDCALLPKLLRYHRGNVTAIGYAESSFSRAAFSEIQIGTPGHPFRGEPVLTLELPDGSRVRTDRLDAVDLRARADRVVPHGAELGPATWLLSVGEEGWRPGVEEIVLGGYRFLVLEGEVVGIGIRARRDVYRGFLEPRPAIAGASGEVFHRLPLDRKTLIALFGKPDALYEDLADPL